MNAYKNKERKGERSKTCWNKIAQRENRTKMKSLPVQKNIEIDEYDRYMWEDWFDRHIFNYYNDE